MWTCKLCCMSFAFESIEQHVYINHVKPTVGCIKVYNCGECSMTAEGFDDIAHHCITAGHEPTRVYKGWDYDGYALQLLTALGQIMCLNEPRSSSKGLSTETLSGQGAAAISSNIKIINWSAPNGGSADSADNVNEPWTGGTALESEETMEDGIPWELTDKAQSELSQTPAFPTEALANSINPNLTEKLGSEAAITYQSESLTADNRVQFKIEGTDCTPSSSGTARPTQSSSNNEGKKLYPCSYCPKKFSGSAAVTRHERTHTGEKPFTCQTCRKSFARKHVLDTHERSHTGEKPYSCSICSKWFVTRSSLNAHCQNLHNGYSS